MNSNLLRTTFIIFVFTIFIVSCSKADHLKSEQDVSPEAEVASEVNTDDITAENVDIDSTTNNNQKITNKSIQDNAKSIVDRIDGGVDTVETVVNNISHGTKTHWLFLAFLLGTAMGIFCGVLIPMPKFLKLIW